MHGLGAVLLHRFPDGSMKAVCHASRTLTDAEKNYAQGEKEGLALVFACTKFHRMIFGRRFTLHTDHKPLLGIFGSKKGVPIHTANRLQRWALTLLQYDFKLEFRSTENFGYADVLSRLIGEHSRPDEDYIIASIQLEADICNIQAEAVAGFPVTYQQIQQETMKDAVLQAVIRNLRDSWPASIPTGDLQVFSKQRESLCEADGCIMFLDRIVIPESLKSAVLKQMHAGHPGMQRMKMIARSFVYWPNIDADIENFVRQCSNCAIAAKAPVKTTLSSWPIPSQPWTRLHLDYAGPYKGRHFLIVVDAYSKWPEVFITDNATATTTVRKLHECIARFGSPFTIVTDNGTQFDSGIFQKFCKQFGIEHIRTPPFHPQSNGQAERFVDTLKRALLKIGGENIEEALQVFLQTYRYTPNPSLLNNISPTEALLGRKVRTTFDLMKRQERPLEFINERQNEQFNQKHGAKERSFAVGEEVYAEIHIRNKRYWAQGVIIEQKGNVVYNVLLQDSRRHGLIRSHANQLRRRTTEATLVQQDNIALPTQTTPYQEENGTLQLQILLDEFSISNHQETNIDDTTPAEEVLHPSSTISELPGPSRLPDEIGVAGPSRLPDDVPESSRLPDITEVPEIQRMARKRTLPVRDPSGRKRRLPSHFEYYDIY